MEICSHLGVPLTLTWAKGGYSPAFALTLVISTWRDGALFTAEKRIGK
ncbi:hypothetical protein SAMN05443244_0966 [Terriglobus roseus]|uniref:Uncharacterized protein n=1 Tax=Terriglobus roseus TaxID=392734 RepID=A0A1H4K289_9BACT|nr:hypothetical protein SAMN05443244_0966 [Terriglobus roseus]